MVMLATVPPGGGGGTGGGGTGGGGLPPDPGTPADLEVREGLDLAFRSLDGSELLRSNTADLFVMTEGLDGIEMLPRTEVLEYRPFMDGAVLSELKVGVRRPSVPLLIWSDDGLSAFLEIRDRLASYAQHRRTNLVASDGVFDLVATSPRGTRTLRVAYLDGWPGTYSGELTGVQTIRTRKRFLRCSFELLSVLPYWQGDRWATPVIGGFTSADWYGDWPGELAPAFSLGTPIDVEVGGDGPSWAKARIGGPLTSLVIDADNFHLTIPGGLRADELFEMDTDPRRPVMQINGVSAWDRVGPAPRLEAMLPGSTTWTINTDGMTVATSVQIFGTNQHERPW